MTLSRVMLTIVVVAALGGCAANEPAPAGAPPAESAAPLATTPPAEVATAVVADDPAAYAVEAVLDPGMGAVEDWEGVHFVSPSRNEGCAILAASNAEPELWGCALASQDWGFSSTDPDSYCFESPVPCGYGIEADGVEPPHPRRRGDPGFPASVAISDPGTQTIVETLPYGHSVSYGAITCVSTEEGVTCGNAASGHGFSVSKSGYELH